MAGFLERFGARKPLVQKGALQESEGPQPRGEQKLRAIHLHGRILSLEANSLQCPANKPANDLMIALHREQIANAPSSEIEEMIAALNLGKESRKLL